MKDCQKDFWGRLNFKNYVSVKTANCKILVELLYTHKVYSKSFIPFKVQFHKHISFKFPFSNFYISMLSIVFIKFFSSYLSYTFSHQLIISLAVASTKRTQFVRTSVHLLNVPSS